MVKTDLRHSNNTTSNKNLHLELDLWIKFVDGGKNPITIWKGTDGFNNYELKYDGNLYKPFWMYGEGGAFNAMYESVQKAKYYLKKWNSKVKSV